jgi:hypothetical protein
LKYCASHIVSFVSPDRVPIHIFFFTTTKKTPPFPTIMARGPYLARQMPLRSYKIDKGITPKLSTKKKCEGKPARGGSKRVFSACAEIASIHFSQ